MVSEVPVCHSGEGTLEHSNSYHCVQESEKEKERWGASKDTTPKDMSKYSDVLPLAMPYLLKLLEHPYTVPLVGDQIFNTWAFEGILPIQPKMIWEWFSFVPPSHCILIVFPLLCLHLCEYFLGDITGDRFHLLSKFSFQNPLSRF
jgi:hypothetical protein